MGCPVRAEDFGGTRECRRLDRWFARVRYLVTVRSRQLWSGLLGGQLCNLSSSRVDELCVGVSVSPQAPATFDCFGEKHPDSLCISRIAGGFRDKVGELLHHRELLVPVKCRRS